MHTHTPAPIPPHEEPFLMADLEMSAEQYNTMQRKQKHSKYRNKKVRIDGHTFDSMMEGARYLDLKQMEAAGEITGLELHPTFDLRGTSGEVVSRYEADFSYAELITPQNDPPYWASVVEDVKGKETDVFRIKKKWMKADHGVNIYLVTSDMVDTRGMAQYVIGDTE